MEDLELVKKFGLEYLRENRETYVYLMEELEPTGYTEESFWSVMNSIYQGGVWTPEKGFNSTDTFNPNAKYFIKDEHRYYSIESKEILYKYMEEAILSLDFEARNFREWCKNKI